MRSVRLLLARGVAGCALLGFLGIIVAWTFSYHRGVSLDRQGGTTYYLASLRGALSVRCVQNYKTPWRRVHRSPWRLSIYEPPASSTLSLPTHGLTADWTGFGFVLQYGRPYSIGYSNSPVEQQRRDSAENFPPQLYLCVPDWFFCGIAALTAYAATNWARQVQIVVARLRNKQCPNCGYDLRATPRRCPECGVVTDGKGDIQALSQPSASKRGRAQQETETPQGAG